MADLLPNGWHLKILNRYAERNPKEDDDAKNES